MEYSYCDWETLNYEGSSTMLEDYSSSNLSETRYSDMTSSLHDELRVLKEEVKELRSKMLPLDKERSYFNIVLAIQEENISLKAKVKALEENGIENSSSSSSDLLNKMKNENSSLKHQLEYLKLKNESDVTTISRLESTILALKATSIESKLCDEVKESNQTSLSKLGSTILSLGATSIESKVAKPVKNKAKNSPIQTISNKKLDRTSKEVTRSVRLILSKTIVNCEAIFDSAAKISVCGPDIVKKYFKSISPTSVIPHKFAKGPTCNCLGTLKITLSNPEKKNNSNETTLYIFQEVKLLILCKKDWMKL